MSGTPAGYWTSRKEWNHPWDGSDRALSQFEWEEVGRFTRLQRFKDEEADREAALEDEILQLRNAFEVEKELRRDDILHTFAHQIWVCPSLLIANPRSNRF